MSVDFSAFTNAPKPNYTEAQLREIWRAKIANIKLAWDEYGEKKLALQSLPFKAVIELTQNCNYRCNMCPQSWDAKFQRYDPNLNMPVEMFAKIADQLFPSSIFIDLRGFGETTILPYWPEIVDELERYPFIEWHLVTNLSLKRDATWEKMIRLGFLLGFSCDGATKETFEKIRGGSHFESVMHNLEVIRKARAVDGRGWIYFISTIQKSNIHELRELVQLARRYDVPEVQFKIVQPGGHDQELSTTEPAVIRNNVESALDAGIDLDVRVTFNDWLFTKDVDPAKVKKAETPSHPRKTGLFSGHPAEDHDYWTQLGMHEITLLTTDASRVSVNQRCFKPFSMTYVSYESIMGTCNHMMWPNLLEMGDLKTQLLKDIWNGEKYQAFRQQLISAQPQDHRCQWCFKHRMDD